MPPALLDSNLFIALDRKFSLSEATQYSKEVLAHAKKTGMDPVILRCVLEEIRRKDIQSAVLASCKVTKIDDGEARMIAEQVEPILTKDGKLTDYKLIAAGQALNDKRPVLVSEDYLLRQEYSNIVSSGEPMSPYQFTAVLDQNSPSLIMKSITKRIQHHFLENQGPDAYRSRHQELKQEVVTHKKREITELGRAKLVERYVSGKSLTKGEKKEIEELRPVLQGIREFEKGDDLLGEFEELKGQICSSVEGEQLSDFAPAVRRLGMHLIEKGQEIHNAGDTVLALRLMDEAAMLIALSSKGSNGLYVKLNGMRATEYLLNQEPLQSIRILENTEDLLGKSDIEDNRAIGPILAVAKLVSGRTGEVEDHIDMENRNCRKIIREFADLFYSHRDYRNAYLLYRFIALRGGVDLEMVDPLYICSWMVGNELDEEIMESIPPQDRRQDNSKSSMPYLTRDYAGDRTELEDPDTPQYLREPMRILRRRDTAKGTLLTCWNKGLSSRIGVNIPGYDKGKDADSIRLNTGPVKVKNTMHKQLYGIRGEIDIYQETDFEFQSTKARE